MFIFLLKISVQVLETIFAGGESFSGTLKSPVRRTFFDEEENCHNRLPSIAGSNRLQLLQLFFLTAKLLFFQMLVRHCHS